MPQFGNSLIRGIHRNHANRSAAIRILSPGFSRVLVESIATGLAQLLVADVRSKQLAMSGIQDGEIQAHLWKPIVQQSRDKRSRHIQRVLHRQRPPWRLSGAAVEPLLLTHLYEVTLPESPQTRVPS